MEPFDRIGRERERINALHDAIAILAAELCRNDGSLRDTVIDRLRDEASKTRMAYPPDGRAVQHPWSVELATHCETIERFALKPPLRHPCDISASTARLMPPAAGTQ